MAMMMKLTEWKLVKRMPRSSCLVEGLWGMVKVNM